MTPQNHPLDLLKTRNLEHGVERGKVDIVIDDKSAVRAPNGKAEISWKHVSWNKFHEHSPHGLVHIVVVFQVGRGQPWQPVLLALDIDILADGNLAEESLR
jgi:hypothetical protein